MKLLLALMVAAVLAVPAGALTPAVTTIPDCFSQVVAPKQLTIACADGNLSLEGLSWTAWGANTATASGRIRANDCDPYCAAGTFRTYPASVTATGQRWCPSGHWQYTHLEWSTRAKPPPGQANLAGEIPYPCSWSLHPGLTAKASGQTMLLTGTAWTRGAPCPPKVTLATGGKEIATATLDGQGGFAYAWRAPAGRHLVVARQTCGASLLYEAVLVVRS